MSTVRARPAGAICNLWVVVCRSARCKPMAHAPRTATRRALRNAEHHRLLPRVAALEHGAQLAVLQELKDDRQHDFVLRERQHVKLRVQLCCVAAELDLRLYDS